MTTPSGRLIAHWPYPLLAALIAAALPPFIQLFSHGPGSLKDPEVWLLSAALGLTTGTLTSLCRRCLHQEALGLSQDRFFALPALSRTINSSPDLGEVYHQFVSQLGRFLPIDRATVALVDEREEEFRIVALSARETTELEQGRYYPLEGSRVAWVLNHNRPALADDISSAAFWDWQALAEEGMKSAVDIPLRNPLITSADGGGRIIGVFSLCSFQPGAYRPADLEFLAAVAEHLACGVENSRRHDEDRVHIRWLEMMHDLEDSLGATLQVEEILRIVSDHAVKAMRADRVLAILPEENGLKEKRIPEQERWRLAGPGIRSEPGWHRLADFGPLVNAVVERKAPMLSRLVSEEAVAGTPLEPIYYSEGIRSLAVIPILNAGRTLGILLVGWRQEGAVSQESLQMLQDLAAHLGTALRNAALAMALKRKDLLHSD